MRLKKRDNSIMRVPNCHYHHKLASRRKISITTNSSWLTSSLSLTLNLVVLINLALNIPEWIQCKTINNIKLQQEQFSTPNLDLDLDLDHSLKPTNNKKLLDFTHQQESVLVNLLNKQQSEFISKLTRANPTIVNGQTIGSRNIMTNLTVQPPPPLPHQSSYLAQDNNWVPINQQQQQQQQQHKQVARASRSLRARPCHGLQANGPTGQHPDQLAMAGSQSLSKLVVNSTTGNGSSSSRSSPSSKSSGQGNDKDGEESGADEDEEEEEEEEGRGQEEDRAGQRKRSQDLLHGYESVAHESALMPPQRAYNNNNNNNNNNNPYQTSDSLHTAGPSSLGTNNNNNNINNPNEPDDEEGPPAGSANESDTPPDEAAARREQEAAEASEAEAADRSALAEQQAAQREIILAQAQSEAKAIREQQEALLRQQQLQQQILMRRHQSYLDDTDPTVSERRKKEKETEKEKKKKKKRRLGAVPAASDRNFKSRDSSYSNLPHESQMAPPTGRQRLSSSGNRASTGDHRHRELELDSRQFERGMRAQGTSNQQQRQQHHHHRAEHNLTPPPPPSRAQPFNLMDNQFSDQPDNNNNNNNIVDRGHLPMSNSAARNIDNLARQLTTASEELGSEDSVNRPQYLGDPANELAALEAALAHSADNLSIGARLNFTNSDLLAAAQQPHHYGAHYGSLGGHHAGGSGGGGGGGGGHYYQYAESHKKGQFDSGFKRGNKKFVITGHSSQHKGHAEGHMKWKGKKGKGNHYWDYKHKNKKHYGGGDGYGGGHHYY